MRRINAVGLLVVLLFVLWPSDAQALKCKALPSLEAKYERYDGIVIGYVEEIGQTGEQKRVDLNVVKSYKGIEDTAITIHEDITWGPSQLGEENLYFLIRTDGGWEHPLCAPTARIDYAAEELEYLRDKEIPLKADASSREASPNLRIASTIAAAAAESAAMTEFRPDASADKWGFILLGAIMAVVIGLGMYRFVKRGGE